MTEQLLKVAEQAAIIGGGILIESFRKISFSSARHKGMGDYVTEVDHRSEQAIIRKIKKVFPGHEIQAEESGEKTSASDYRWVIDPLDGTTNYIHGIAVFSVSIAVMRGSDIVLGVVYDPVQNEKFSALRGKGASLNSSPISVSSKNEMKDVLLATGFPWRSRPLFDGYMKSFKSLFLRSAGARRMGSAAIDLCYVACGRFDGFWELNLKPWDIAAGTLIVQEAGGRVSDFSGEDDYMLSGNVVAANQAIHPLMIEETRKIPLS